MIKRILTAVIGIPLLIYIINSGGIIFFISLMIVSSVGLWEYSKSVNKNKQIKINYILEISLGIFLLCIFNYKSEWVVPGVVFSFMMIFVYEIIKGKADILQGIFSFFGIMYIPILFGHILLFQTLRHGMLILWLVFIICFSTDTFAYLIGIRFGKHKLCPNISPKKSVEGAIAGTIGSVIMSLTYGYLLNFFNLLDFSLYYYFILAFITSILSQFGDLTASLIKRYFGVKDFGNILPGHGGVLDRFDSIIFAAPIVYYFTLYSLNGVITWG
ncbi:MAG: phosphatidate cytidylyltransferase [Eubacteriales bacterium]